MKRNSWLAGVCLLAVATPAAAQAQGAADTNIIDPQDIIVTATRREQRLQDIPLAVSAISGEALRTRGIESATDLGTGKIPGLAVNSMFGSEVSVALNIRGYGTSDVSQGTQDQAVAFYIDGINLPRAQGMAMELITPERIEVLRGPQGQLFGRNAEAGAIQVVSRRPSGVLGGDFSGGYGNFNGRFVKGRLELPEFAGFRVQLSGIYRAHDGYIRNVANPLLQNVQLQVDPRMSFRFPTRNYDSDLSQLLTHGFRIAVERDFGDLNVFYSYDDSWARDDQGLTHFVVSPDKGTIFNPSGNTGPASFTISTGQTFRQNPLDTSQYPRDVPYSQLYVPFVTKSHGHLLNLTLQATDDLTIKTITGVRQSTRYGGNDLSVALSFVQPSALEFLKSDTFSHEVQAIYNKSNFNLTTGALYFYENVTDERDAGFATNCVGIPGTPCDPGGQPTRPFYRSALNRQFSKTDAYALYGQASWKPGLLDDRLEITAGLRYSHDTKRARRVVAGGVNLVTPITNVANTDRIDPAVMLRVQWTPDINTYARFARGFRDGGANVRSQIFNAYQPETLDSYEIGLKSQWFNRRMTLNVSAFHNDVNNQQQSLQSNPAINPSLTDTFNVPLKYKTDGVEVELSVRPVQGLTLSGNYTYLRSNRRYLGIDSATLSSFVLNNPTIRADGALIPSASDVAAHPNAQFLQLYPIGAPKHAGGVSLDYVTPVSTFGRLSFHAEWVRAGDMIVASPVRLFTLAATAAAPGSPTIVTPRPYYVAPSSSNRVNGRVSLGDIALASGAKAEISIWAKNLFNHVDISHAFAAGNADLPTRSAVYLQPPRTYGADLRITF